MVQTMKKLELKIKDEERMFDKAKLTASEVHKLEIDKELLQIAKTRKTIDRRNI